MKITDAIEQLHDILMTHGDLEVATFNGQYFMVSHRYSFAAVDADFGIHGVGHVATLIQPEQMPTGPHLRLVK